MSRAVVGAVAGLTAVALALRIPGLDQTLYGDEDFTYYIVVGNGLGEVWDAVYETSVTPPLHYVLAWLSLRFGGDGTVLVRLPSLVFGTALVPLVFLLGRRVASSRAGLLAAALVAFSPFAIWYSDEARAYATMMFLVAASTLSLLEALRGGRRVWWVLFALCSCAALWTHYTAVFVIAAQALWALWARRGRRRELLLALGAVALGYLPWVPGFLAQRQNEEGIATIDKLAEPSLAGVFELPIRTLVGHGEFGLADFPGVKGLVVAAIVAAGLAAIAAPPIRRRRLLVATIRLLRSERGLIVVLAVATPVGLLAYAALESSLFMPRNLAASLPALAVLVAIVANALLTRLPLQPAALVALALMAVLAVNAGMALGDSWRRPPVREAVAYIERTAADADPVVESPPPVRRDERLPEITIDRYMDDERPIYSFGAEEPWEQLREGRTVYLVGYELILPSNFAELSLGSTATIPRDTARRMNRIGGPDGRALLRRSTVFDGRSPIVVAEYDRRIDGRLTRSGGRETISWTLGRRVTVTPGAARGAVERVTPAGPRLAIGGWALSAGRPPRPADWVLLFSGRRLLSATVGVGARPDVVAAHGPSALLSGFFSLPRVARSDRSRLRAFAVVGDEAGELPMSRAARRALR